MKKKNIYYKVVGKKHRFGSNHTMLFGDKDMCGLFAVTKSKSKIFKKFFPQYKNRTVVKAARGSQGIFCFRSLQYARFFRRDCEKKFRRGTAIIRVEGIGKPNYNPHVIPNCGYTMEGLLSFKNTKSAYNAPAGSISFKSVKVLE
jgi:hypothetical protein